MNSTVEFSSQNGKCISNGTHNKTNSKIEQFVSHSSNGVNEIIKILETRLPFSSHVYNMAKMYDRLSPIIKAYSYQGDLSTKSIVMLTTTREDFGQDISISVPDDFLPTPEIKEAFSTTTAIDWENSPYLFSSVDRKISPMILEISTLIKRNSTVNNPNYLFGMDREEASNLEIKVDDPNLEILPVDLNIGSEFLLKHWKYTQTGTREFVQNILKKLPSSGLYDKRNGQIQSGILIYPHGLFGMLSTAHDARNKGYATLVMRHLIKQLAADSFVPSSGVEMKNTASVYFHKKIGMKIIQECDYVYHLRTPFS